MTENWHDMTALQLGAGIEAGEIDPSDLAEFFLARIDEADEDQAIFITRTPDRARAEAKAASGRAKVGLRRGALDGVPISWKDLVDSAGTPTTGASELFRDRVPERDAVILARGTRAGMVCLGKTNLSEFAFSGLGINPAFGTPKNPFDTETPRCPGGSSAGSAVSVARGLAPITVGTDTGGSVRIPAAWNGLVGLKTTSGVVPTQGVLPLSRQYDTVGPLAKDVADANALFAVLADIPAADLTGAGVRGRRFLAPTNVVWDLAEPALRTIAESAIESLAQAGAHVEHAELSELNDVTELASQVGNVFSPEAYAEWRTEIETQGERIHHEVMRRFKLGEVPSAIDVAEAQHKLRAIRASYLRSVAGYDAVLMPTAPIVPPAIAPLENDTEAYAKANAAALYNTRLGNLLALSSLTLPAGLADGLPVGLMLFGAPRREAALLRLGAGVEKVLAVVQNNA